MEQAILSAATRWANFYVIMGSAAGALTGLQFVVMTLITEGRATGGSREVSAFGTPTVVHFCVTLIISALMSAPWTQVRELQICLCVCAIAGVAYGVQVIHHARKATYNPDLEDWFWYSVVPMLAYLSLGTGGLLLRSHPGASLFVIAATTLLFLFTGIHNSWDTVTYIALKNRQDKNSA